MSGSKLRRRAPPPTQGDGTSGPCRGRGPGDSITLKGRSLDGRGELPCGSPSTSRRESVTIVRAPQIPGVEMQLIRHSRRKWTIYHSSFDFCCAVRTANAIDWSYRHRTNTMSLGSLGILVPGEMHRVLRIRDECDYLLLLIEPGVMARFLEDDESRLLYSLRHQLDGRSHGTLLGELWSAINDRVRDSLRIEGLISEFLLSISQHSGIESSTDKPVHEGTRIVRDYLHDNHHRNVTLDECAKLTGTSKFHLHRSFVAELGVPPHQYLSGVRISRARDLLRGGARPADVASLTGFCDQSHLTRVFTEIVGLTPGAYAAQFSSSHVR